LPVFQVKSRERKQSPGLDFLPTFLSMKKVGKKKDRKNSAFLKRTSLTIGYKLSALPPLPVIQEKFRAREPIGASRFFA
jgi:hypothetical protein